MRKNITPEKNKQNTITEIVEQIIPGENGLGATHLFVGDNLDVLPVLEPDYKGKVDVIFIDPPYNTGKKFYSYQDKLKGPSRSQTHEMWVGMMRPRLSKAIPFLRETGVFITAIGVKEQPYLRLLLDELMGEENFVSMVTMGGMLKNNASFVSTSNEYWLIYAKNKSVLKKKNIKWRAPKKSAQFLLNRSREIWFEADGNKNDAEQLLRKYFRSSEAEQLFKDEPGLKMYNRYDVNGRVYRTGDLSSPDNKGGNYVVVNPETKEVVVNPVRGWVHSQETFNRMIVEDRIEWNGNKTPYYKRYLDESLTVVKNDICYPNRLSPSRMLRQMIGRNKFTFPKDHLLIAEWLEYVIPQSRMGDIENPPIVLDFFAGSGSTAHAVAELNHKNMTNMVCVLVTSDENNIPFTVTIPRLKAMVTGEWDSGTKPGLPGSLTIHKVITSR